MRRINLQIWGITWKGNESHQITNVISHFSQYRSMGIYPKRGERQREIAATVGTGEEAKTRGGATRGERETHENSNQKGTKAHAQSRKKSTKE